MPERGSAGRGALWQWHTTFAPAQAAPARTIIDAPLISFGREICGEITAALRREWLVTNGLGGYASGTLAGINTLHIYRKPEIANRTQAIVRAQELGLLRA